MSPAEAHPRSAIALGAAVNAIGGGLGWSLLPPLLPAIALDLGLSHAAGGLVWGAAPLGIALASPLGGAAVDRFGPRRVAGLALLAGALACAARALAVGPWSMAAAMFAFGLHIGFTAPAVPKLLAGHVPASHLGRANGLSLLAYTLGTAATVLTARTLIAPALGGWRPTMVAAGLAMAVTAVVWLVAARDRTLHAGHPGLEAFAALLGNANLRRVAVAHFLLFGGYLALLGLLPRALADAGVPLARIGPAVALWLGAAAVANFAGPWISDRLGRRRPVVLGGAAVAAAGLGLLALLPATTSAWLLGVAALGGGCVAPLLLALPLELPGVGPARAGAALGVLMLVGQIGGFLLPVVAGWATQAGGFAAALGVLAAVHAGILPAARRLAETGWARRGGEVPLARAA